MSNEVVDFLEQLKVRCGDLSDRVDDVSKAMHRDISDLISRLASDQIPPTVFVKPGKKFCQCGEVTYFGMESWTTTLWDADGQSIVLHGLITCVTNPDSINATIVSKNEQAAFVASSATDTADSSFGV